MRRGRFGSSVKHITRRLVGALIGASERKVAFTYFCDIHTSCDRTCALLKKSSEKKEIDLRYFIGVCIRIWWTHWGPFSHSIEDVTPRKKILRL